jgi:hypothetical protein
MGIRLILIANRNGFNLKLNFGFKWTQYNKHR